MKKFQFLDSTRGIAVLLVLLVHSGAVSELFGIKAAVAAFGQRGVQLFYEVSAFSLLYSVNARGESSWRAFFIRRFFRIAPLFYLSMAANWVATVWIGKGSPLTAGAYLSGILFLFGFHPDTINAVAPAGWSIAVETTFYALFPLLALAINSLRRAVTLTAVTTLGCFLFCYHAHGLPIHGLPSEYLEFLWFPAQAPVFCMGFVAYYAWKDLVPTDQCDFCPLCIPDSRRARRIASAILMGAGLAVLAASFPASNHSLYVDSFALLLVLLALALWPWQLFVNPLTAWIGKLSYSVYLVHPYLRAAVSAALDWLWLRHSVNVFGTYYGLILTLGLFLSGSLLIAAFTYPCIEKPGIQLGQWIIQRWHLSSRRRQAPIDLAATPNDFTHMTESEQLQLLKRRLRASYFAWMVSLACMLGFAVLYHNDDPQKIDRPIAQYREQVVQYQSQLDALSAGLLQNQRELKDTQKQLLQVMADYRNAIETIKRLQSRPPG